MLRKWGAVHNDDFVMCLRVLAAQIYDRTDACGELRPITAR